MLLYTCILCVHVNIYYIILIILYYTCMTCVRVKCAQALQPQGL